MLHAVVRLGLLPLLLGAPVPPKAEVPKGPPPELEVVQSVDSDKGTILVVATQQVPETRVKTVTEFVNVGGKEVAVQKQVTYTVLVPVFLQKRYNLNDDKLSATDTSGKKLTKDNLLKLLEPGKVIAITRGPTGLDPVYRAALARDVAILSFPAEQLPTPAPIITPEPIRKKE
jgi:hypothetical protein